jgi:multiple sugar transport system ATP-binding protein
MNVARNMSFALRLAHYPKEEIDKRVTDVATMLGIEELLARKPRELSGGQRQRVAMGRAMVRDAGTFLFDEPLSNLDAKLRTQMRAELALMRRRLNKNMIYVTHDQIEAMTLGDRIVVMHNGIIQQEGSPEELFKRPANRFVAGFIGSPAMNFLNARLTDDNGHPAVDGEGFAFRLPDGRAEALRPYKDRPVIVGVRPSAFASSADGDGVNTITLPALVSEYIGAHSVLIADCGGTQVTVDIDSETPIAVGESLSFTVDPSAIYLFDSETEVTL